MFKTTIWGKFGILALALLGSMHACVTSAYAQDRVQTIQTQHYQQVRLGFNGSFNGYGMQVNDVFFGTVAESIGLESGDVIVAINGRPIRSYGQYLQLLNHSGNFLRLEIEDVNTGNIVLRSVRLFRNDQNVPASRTN